MQLPRHLQGLSTARVVGLGILSDEHPFGFLLHKRGDTLHLAWYGDAIVSQDGQVLQTLEAGRVRASIPIETFAKIERVFLEEAWLRMKEYDITRSFKLTWPWPMSMTLGKELAVLLWASESGNNLEAVKRGWLDLHCTERWWFYEKGEVMQSWRKAIQAALGAI